MTKPLDYIKTNKASWNNRLESHLNSEFYDLEGFKKGNCSLKSIELNLLGDLKNKKILHLQCHFGQDSISLARRGAEVTAVDLSDKAIDKARALAAEENLDINFICCNIYELKEFLNESFDIIFTSYGTIGWLPDLNKWAAIIEHFLAPKGKFVFVEFHPVVWMFDDNFKTISYDYFNSGEIIEEESGTYADRDAPIQQSYVCWNHSLSEVFQSLKQHKLLMEDFMEYDYSPYACFNNAKEYAVGKYRISTLKKLIPMVYSIVAVKR